MRAVDLVESDRARRAAIDEGALPQFELQQGPDAVGVVAGAGDVVVDETGDVLPPEVPALDGRLVEQDIARQVP